MPGAASVQPNPSDAPVPEHLVPAPQETSF
jgi:hypothetical protein